MGLYDEVLKGVSEALRISQNNGDDEGINQCLCYLYQISGLIGNSNEVEIILNILIKKKEDKIENFIRSSLHLK